MAKTKWTEIKPRHSGPQSETISELRIRPSTIGFSGKLIAEMGWSAGDRLRVDIIEATSRRARFTKAEEGFRLRKPTSGPALVLNAPSLVGALKGWQGRYCDITFDGASCIVICEPREALPDA